MSSPEYTGLSNAIAKYKSSVARNLDIFKRALVLDFSFIVFVPIILSVISYFFAGVAGFLTTLGLGGINASERFSRGHTIIKTYWGDCEKLRRTVETLEIMLQILMAKPVNERPSYQKKIEDLIPKYYDKMPHY